MKTFLPGAVVAAILLCFPVIPAVAQSVDPNDNVLSYNHVTYVYTDVTPIDVTGEVTRSAGDGDRIVVRTDDGRRFLVDTYNAAIVAPDSNYTQLSSLSGGVRVRISGRLLGGHFIAAGRVSIVVNQPVALAPPVAVVPLTTADTAEPVTLTATVLSIVGDQNQLFVTDDADQVYRIKAGDADIILPHGDRAGTLADLSRGDHVRIIGDKERRTVIKADRIRLLPDEAPAPPPVVPAPQPLDLSVFTGILIDVRGFENIQRSPNPSISDADSNLVYPDRSHVPSPDEVQDESTVRYYRSMDDAMAGVGGSHPLVLQAVAVVGPAEDGVTLSPDDASLFKQLDQRLHYTQNWKVGFIIPSDR